MSRDSTQDHLSQICRNRGSVIEASAYDELLAENCPEISASMARRKRYLQHSLSFGAS